MPESAEITIENGSLAVPRGCPALFPIHDPDLIPFRPPNQPMPLVAGLRTFMRNYVESFPRAVYEQPSTRVKGSLSDTLFVSDPALVQELLLTRADEFGRDIMTQRAFEPIISRTSLFLAEGAEWRWQRRAVAPTFRHDALLSYVPVFADMAARQIERWRTTSRDAPVDALAAMTRTTFEVIAEILFGSSDGTDAERFARALSTTFDAAIWHSLLALLSAPRWMPFPGRRKAHNARDHMHREAGRIIAARRSQAPSRRDLVDRLLAARDPETGRVMTDGELATNLLTFMAAGHETTAVALTWALWLVAKYPQVQQRLLEETWEVAGHAAIEVRHVEALSFTRQVLQEAMRLYPPVPALSRQSDSATQLGGHHVSRHTHIMVPIFALHRHVRLWDDPNAFDPRRFAPDHVKARSRFAYLPFGAGPRVCIGSSFAMIEASVVLATLVRAFRFRPVPAYKPAPIARVTLRPQGGMPLFIEPRPIPPRPSERRTPAQRTSNQASGDGTR
jgi:cytochrome P450